MIIVGRLVVINQTQNQIHHFCRQEDDAEQEDRNNAKVSPQRRSLAEKPVIGIFYKTVNQQSHS